MELYILTVLLIALCELSMVNADSKDREFLKTFDVSMYIRGKSFAKNTHKTLE